jgi:hypothetical protein
MLRPTERYTVYSYTLILLYSYTLILLYSYTLILLYSYSYTLTPIKPTLSIWHLPIKPTYQLNPLKPTYIGSRGPHRGDGAGRGRDAAQYVLAGVDESTHWYTHTWKVVLYTHTYTHIHTFIHTYIHIHTHIYIHTFTYTHTYTHIHTYTYMYYSSSICTRALLFFFAR